MIEDFARKVPVASRVTSKKKPALNISEVFAPKDQNANLPIPDTLETITKTKKGTDTSQRDGC